MLTRNRNFEKITGQIFNAKLLKFESRFFKKTWKKGLFLGTPKKGTKKGVLGGGSKMAIFGHFRDTRFCRCTTHRGMRGNKL